MESAVKGLPVMIGARLRIGLLGGSFNPAHEGHLHISREALKRLKLNRVWWLVSPRNPLKEPSTLAAFSKRLSGARTCAAGASVDVLDFEEQEGFHHTIDTLRALRAAHPKVNFVWLMGADCFIDCPRWKEWETIFATVPIAVFTRPGYSLQALNSLAARRFHKWRVPASRASVLATTTPPAWVYLEGPQTAVSASALRAQANQPKARMR